MTSLLVITLVLQIFILIALFWTSKKFFIESKTLRSLLIKQGETLEEKAERLTNSAEKMGGCTDDIKGLSDWTKAQELRKAQEVQDNETIVSHSEIENVTDPELPISLMTDIMLSRDSLVATALSQIIDQAQVKINEALECNDFRSSESILAKLHLVLEKHLFRCRLADLTNIYKRARQLTLQADEAAISKIKSSTLDEALAKDFPPRLLSLSFTEGEIKEGQEKVRLANRLRLFQQSCEEIAQEASQLDAKQTDANLKLSRLELRLAQLLSSSPDLHGLPYLSKASEAIRVSKIKCEFHNRLAEGKLTEAGIKAAFDRIASVRSDLSQEVLHGYIFEEIDKAMAICSFFLSVTTELGTSMFNDECHAIPQRDFVELKSMVNDKQYRAYNSWALWLITETKKDLKKREPSFNPMFDYKALVLDLFPRVFNHVDDAMLNASVSRLFYELHSKLIDLIKKDYDAVRGLINDQIFHPKVGIYKLNDQ